MFCNRCGSALIAGVQYCTQCGQAVASVPPPAGAVPAVPYPATYAPAGGRVAHHRNTVGVLWLVLGAFGMIGAMVLFILASSRPWENPYSTGAPAFLAPMFSAIALLLLIFSAKSAKAVAVLDEFNWLVNSPSKSKVPRSGNPEKALK